MIVEGYFRYVEVFNFIKCGIPFMFWHKRNFSILFYHDWKKLSRGNFMFLLSRKKSRTDLPQTPVVINQNIRSRTIRIKESLERFCQKNPDHEKAKRMLSNYTKAEKGESLTLAALRRVPFPMLIIQDYSFKYGDISTQIDFLVITETYFFVIDSKWRSGNYKLDNHGEFINVGYQKRESDPIAQNQEHIEYLKKILADIPVKLNERFQNIVVWANEESVVDRSEASSETASKIIYVKQIVSHISSILENKEKLKKLTPEKMQSIADFLTGYSEGHPIQYICPVCGGHLEKRTSQLHNSTFWGCKNFCLKNCYYIETVE